MRRRRALLAAAVPLLAAAGILAAFRRPDAAAVRPPERPWMADGPRDAAVLWAVGDGADGDPAARRLAARIAAGRPDRFLYLGDVYARGPFAGALEGDGSDETFEASYDTVYGRLARRTAPTPGNHEWGNAGEGYEPYWRRVTGRPPPAFYAFRAGGWEILMLNSEVSRGPGSEQLAWLGERLRESGPGTCRIAAWHRPRFSAGSHGDAEDVAPLWDALRGSAALVLSGHDHNSQRFAPVGGIVQVVAGAGGHGLYGVEPRRGLRWADDEHDAAVRIALRPGRARLTFVAADGRKLDSSEVRCSRGA